MAQKITPRGLLQRINNVIKMIQAEADSCHIIDELTSFWHTEWDSDYFKEDQAITNVKDILDLCICLLFLNIRPNVVEELQKIEGHLEPIIVRELLFVNRFFKQDCDDKSIGILNDVPDLVKFEIRRKVYELL